MLSKEDNELLTRTDRGTPMGEAFRRFWLPALLSEELPGADCNPVRVRILGEELVAFRDSNGVPGLLDAYCPHRGAPLFFGRNEECGLRCLYHGWKFDVTGQCVEMPNIPHGDTARARMRTIAYPAVEAAGMVWVYMGPGDRKPPFPELPYVADVSAENVYVTRYEINCNWLQAQEGDYDPSHAKFVHSTLGDNRDVAGEVFGQGRPGSLKPEAPLNVTVAVEETPAGVMFATSRPMGDEVQVVGRQLVLPCFSNSGIAPEGIFSANIRVPIDDEHENHFRLRWTRRGFTDRELNDFKHGGYTFPLHESGTYLAKERKANDYRYDPVLQRQFNYSGVVPFPTQDLMMIENQWGPVADRTREHLVASDRTIIAVRRRFLKMAKALAEGIEPEEPFHLKAVRQASPESVRLAAGQRLSAEQLDGLLAGLNTGRLSDADNREYEAMWAPSVEVDPNMPTPTDAA